MQRNFYFFQIYGIKKITRGTKEELELIGIEESYENVKIFRNLLQEVETRFLTYYYIVP